MHRLVISLALAATTLSACATPPREGAGPDRHAHRGPPGGPHGLEGAMAGRPGIFISPMGQTFRSAPGEAYPSALWFSAVDINNDGRLDQAEFTNDAQIFFNQLDLNHDDVIDNVENQAYEGAMPTEPRGGGGGQGGGRGGSSEADAGHPSGGRGGGKGGGRRRGAGGGKGRSDGGSNVRDAMVGAARYGMLGDAQPVLSADTDLSQTVTLAEFKASAVRRFARLDVNGDGIVLFAELPLTPAQQVRAR